MSDDLHDLKEELMHAEEAVGRSQEGNAGFAEAQASVKQAEEKLSDVQKVQGNGTEASKKELQRDQDLLRLIRETNEAVNSRRS